MLTSILRFVVCLLCPTGVDLLQSHATPELPPALAWLQAVTRPPVPLQAGRWRPSLLTVAVTCLAFTLTLPGCVEMNRAAARLAGCQGDIYGTPPTCSAPTAQVTGGTP